MDEKHMIWLIIACLIGFFMKFITLNLVCKNVCPLVEGDTEADQLADYEEYEDMEKERLRMRTAISEKDPEIEAEEAAEAAEAAEEAWEAWEIERDRVWNSPENVKERERKARAMYTAEEWHDIDQGAVPR